MTSSLVSAQAAFAAVGFRVHSGWAAFVALSLDGKQPKVLARGRPYLVETFAYKYRQPYHTAERMPVSEAQAFVSSVETEAKRLAARAFHSLQSDLQKRGYKLFRFALIRASARPLPAFDKILSSHALIHTADGELFREALVRAGEQRDMSRFDVRESELVDYACKILRIRTAALTSSLTALGKPLGPPWSQDEKFAALAAWLALATGPNSPDSQ